MFNYLLNSFDTRFVQPRVTFHLRDVNIEDFLTTDEKTEQIMKRLRDSDKFDCLLKMTIRYVAQDITIESYNIDTLNEISDSNVKLTVAVDKNRAIQSIKFVYADNMSDEDVQFAIIYNIALASLQNVQKQNLDDFEANKINENILDERYREIHEEALKIARPIIASCCPELKNSSSLQIATTHKALA